MSNPLLGGYIFKSEDRKRKYYDSQYLEDTDFLPVSVEIIENDTNIYQNNTFFTPTNNKSNQELVSVKKIKEEVKNSYKYTDNTSKVPILKIRLNKNKFQIIGKKIRCRLCPSKVNRKTVYRCTKCLVPICLSHAVSFCPPCTNEMPKDFNVNQRDVVRYPFFRIGQSLKRACGYCVPKLNRKSRSQCNDCSRHICGEHKKYVCEFCAIGYSRPLY